MSLKKIIYNLRPLETNQTTSMETTGMSGDEKKKKKTLEQNQTT